MKKEREDPSKTTPFGRRVRFPFLLGASYGDPYARGGPMTSPEAVGHGAPIGREVGFLLEAMGNLRNPKYQKGRKADGAV